jgi:PKD repeat protein
MEGADTWSYDPPTPVHPMFFIIGVEDGGNDLTQIQGYTGTFTEGMSFSYAGDNAYVDRLAPLGNSWSIFKNLSPAYVNAIAFDSTLYKTIGSSFEFGGLADATFPSTKVNLLEKYLTFFGIQIPSLDASFAGYPNPVVPGGQVTFTDFSTGGVTSWNWSFPGGVPETSGEQNPVVTYASEGTYDVQLIVSNGVAADTLLKQAYIQVGFPVSTEDRKAPLVASVFPNPTPGTFTITVGGAASGRMTLRLLNILGNVVWQSEGTASGQGMVKHVSLSLPDGIYFLNILSDSGSVTKRLVITR